MITAKLDVTKIEKARLFKGNNGAMYLDCILIETPNNQYGDDYMIVQSVTQEERATGTRGPILGNAKILGRKSAQQEESPKAPAQDSDDSEIPF